MNGPARSRRDALDRYRHHLQQTLTCVSSRHHWQARPARTADERLLQPAPDDGVVGLRCSNGRRLWLLAEQRYHLTQAGLEWKVVTDGYAYTVSEAEDLASELWAWHWHPASRPDPHLHVGRRHDVHGDLGRLHVPTGRVAFEQVVLFLIEDLGAVAQRDDWQTVATDVLDRFRQHRTWA